MLWSILMTTMGLLFVFEGILPFLAPSVWRRMMNYIVLQSDRALHIMGLISMLVGLALVSIARDLY